MPVELGRVLIIGGGICGLTAAIALRKRGYDAVVYEQAESLQPIGAGISLWPNALRVLRQLGLADAVIAAGARVDKAEILESTGRPISVMDGRALAEAAGEPLVGIHRAALQQVLEDALPASSVVLGARLVGIEQIADTVEARFADGSAVRGSLLIGADGLHSRVRKHVAADVALRHAGYCAWRGVARARLTPGWTAETWGCGARFGMVPLDAERIYWFATANRPQGEVRTGAGHHALLAKLFGDWHAPVPALLEATPQADILCHDIYDIAPMSNWHRKRVVLAGDAAHPTTPNLGQGACMAMESSLVLARCLARASQVETALQDFEQLRRRRTAGITRESHLLGRVGQLAHPLGCRVRNAVMRSLPAGLVQARMRQLVGAEI